MATVPQKVILKTAFLILDPPVFAAVAPRMIKKKQGRSIQCNFHFFQLKKERDQKG